MNEILSKSLYPSVVMSDIHPIRLWLRGNNWPMKSYFHFHKLAFSFLIKLRYNGWHCICNIKASVWFCISSVVQYICCVNVLASYWSSEALLVTQYIYCVIGLTSYWSSDAVGVKKLLRHCTDQLLVERGTLCKIYAVSLYWPVIGEPIFHIGSILFPSLIKDTWLQLDCCSLTG